MEKMMRKYKGKRLTPIRAIRIYCREICCCGDLNSWKQCTFVSCPLFGYRLGKRPKIAHKTVHHAKKHE